MTFMPHIIGLAFALLLALTPGAWAQRGPAAVGVEVVEFRPFAETVPVFAEVVTSRAGTVAARVSGNVASIEVSEGERITAGTPLVELDRELLTILLRRAEAEVAVAEAGLEGGRVRADTARTAFERIEGLRGTSAFSDSRFDDARGQLLEAESRIAEAEARLAVAEAARAEAAYNLERTTIPAPYDGTVLEVLVNPGEVLPVGAPVLRLLDTGSLEIEAAVPAQYVALLEPGMTVTARADGGTEYEVAVRALVPVETAATRTRPVRFASPELARARTTALGQSITVLIPVGAERPLLTVPKDALVQARGGWTVFAVVDGVAQSRTVEIGLASGDRFEVLSGLAEGDVVVVRGNERLRPGQEVQAMGQGDGAAGGPARQASN